ncbi:peptide ABC transporter ATP-binding protein [Alicyclobacillus cellulosilyticus]|uniref:Peptide ABC transporter ATP-binding protein n=1 Tax=Alicyclobacillus cellulosilyticus TaxID=1003997 RepID=A0A917K1R5_9BACL|nr:ABC transporter ATP-binding protein [Alicyclobacillus cellulosilyticus]GGI96544.1 peptide ABC transporter ATP-binding protein [Alicyclobacillus cellulosilyticus]
MSLLQVRKLTKFYAAGTSGLVVKALDRLDLDVPQGEFVCIMGPSGSGKSTLLNIVAGLERPTSGQVVWDGRDVTRLSAKEWAALRRRDLGFVFQTFNLLDALTVEENVALPLMLNRVDVASAAERVRVFLSELNLLEIADRYPHELSGGQQQRVAVARAMVHRPKLVLADEPTGSLDSASSQSVLELFMELNAVQTTTILMATHDPFAASYAHRVVFMKDGKVYNQLDRAGSRRSFFHEILHALSVLEEAVL